VGDLSGIARFYLSGDSRTGSPGLVFVAEARSPQRVAATMSAAWAAASRATGTRKGEQLT
jgi:hypothetical protein